MKRRRRCWVGAWSDRKGRRREGMVDRSWLQQPQRGAGAACRPALCGAGTQTWGRFLEVLRTLCRQVVSRCSRNVGAEQASLADNLCRRRRSTACSYPCRGPSRGRYHRSSRHVGQQGGPTSSQTQSLSYWASYWWLCVWVKMDGMFWVV